MLFYGRALEVLVEGTDEVNEVFAFPDSGDAFGNGLHIRFSITKSFTGQQNSCSLTLYNLAPGSENRITAPNVPITLAAGYRGDTNAKPSHAVIFAGQVRESRSEKLGVDRQTTLTATTRTGDEQVTLSVIQGEPITGLMIKLLQSMTNLRTDKAQRDVLNLQFRTATATIIKSATVQGSAWVAFQRLMGFTSGYASVQDGEVVIDTGADPTSRRRLYISPQTGLIGTPAVSTSMSTNFLQIVNFRSLLQPELAPHDLVDFETDDGTGTAKIRVVQHTGDTHGNDWYSDVEGEVVAFEGAS